MFQAFLERFSSASPTLTRRSSRCCLNLTPPRVTGLQREVQRLVRVAWIRDLVQHAHIGADVHALVQFSSQCHIPGCRYCTRRYIRGGTLRGSTAHLRTTGTLEYYGCTTLEYYGCTAVQVRLYADGTYRRTASARREF